MISQTYLERKNLCCGTIQITTEVENLKIKSEPFIKPQADNPEGLWPRDVT